MIEQTGNPGAAPLKSPSWQAPSVSGDAQTPDPPSPIRPSKTPKFKGRRAAKQRAQQEAKEEATTRTEVVIEAS